MFSVLRITEVVFSCQRFEFLRFSQWVLDLLSGEFVRNVTCKIDRAPRYARMSLFKYPHPSRSAMKTNFSCPGGILIHQG